MKQKLLIILVAVVIILMILLIPKVESLNDGGTKIYKALAYEVTKLHKIKEASPNSEFVEGTMVKIFGKEVYNDIPEETQAIYGNKELKEENNIYEKTLSNVKIKIEIPKTWNYEEKIKLEEENDFYKYALKMYKNNENEYAILYLYTNTFGVCGTGRTSKQIKLNNGKTATIGYYDNNETWQDISFYEENKNIAILNEGLGKEDAEEFLNFVKTIDITEENEVEMTLKEGTLTSTGATFIIKNNTENDYWYGSEYGIEVKKDGEWKPIELEEPLTWTAIAIILKANGENEINIDFNYGYGELAKGKYRLVKKVSKAQKETRDDERMRYIYAEFEIE